MEVAMKLARQYHLEKRPPQPQRDLFLSRQQSYHGATLGTLALSGHVNRRARYEPLMLGNMRKTAACNAYRGQGADESDSAYVNRLASRLEEDIKSCGPERICAFVAETICGAVCSWPLLYFVPFQPITYQYGYDREPLVFLVLCASHSCRLTPASGSPLAVLPQWRDIFKRSAPYATSMIFFSFLMRSCAGLDVPEPCMHGSRKAWCRIFRPSPRV